MKDSEFNPWEVLGVTQDTSDEAIRAAYLALVRENPPETAPDAFEQIRDAYEILRDPRQRMRHMLSADPTESFDSLLDRHPPDRRFVGPQPWLQALEELTHGER